MIRRSGLVLLYLILTVVLARAAATDSTTVPAFPIESSDIQLSRLAQPGSAFDKCGRKFVILGDESGAFEAWAYPLKLFRNVELEFFVGGSTRPVKARDIVYRVTVNPAVTTLTYVYQSFSVRAHYLTAIDQPGALILLEVNSTEPLTIVCSFLPVLQPMWPAGLGGQWSYWRDEDRAYLVGATGRKTYALIGSPAGEGMSYTPAHMLADDPSQFKIEIDNPEAVGGRFIPIAMTGGRGEFDDILAVYKALLADPAAVYQTAKAHYNELLASTIHVDTPDDSLDLAFEWAKIAYDNLFVDNPDIEGTGMVAGLARSGTSGRPGFGWFFGGDACINSFSLNRLGMYDHTRMALAFQRQFQREDGKIAHEITQAVAYCNWFEDYHYAYIHGDTSPYYVAAMWDYLKHSGDLAFVKESWESVTKAYQWSRATDANGDGLMDNKAAGLGALEYGTLTDGITTDIYIGGIWVLATDAMAHLATAVEDSAWVKIAAEDAKRARQAFDDKFWDAGEKFYAYAFNDKGEHVRSVSPWNSFALAWGIGQDDRALASLSRLAGPGLITDWGVRSISEKSELYSPLNYNYGAVWPFLNSWVATAFFRYGMVPQGYLTLRSTALNTFEGQLGAIHEVFSGSLHTWPQESVSHQGFSTAGAVLPVISGLMGLDWNALGSPTLSFSPRVPADWDAVEVTHVPVGISPVIVADLSCQPGDTTRISASGNSLDLVDVIFQPARPAGAKYIGAVLHQDPAEPSRMYGEVAFDTTGSLLITTFPSSRTHRSRTIEAWYTPALEIVPPLTVSPQGARNEGVKITGFDVSNPWNRELTLSGLAGSHTTLYAGGWNAVQSVQGATATELWPPPRIQPLQVDFPDGAPGTWIEKKLIFRLKPADVPDPVYPPEH